MKKPKIFLGLFSTSVRMEGLEPPRLSAPDPKSGTATNYATCAYMDFRIFMQKLQENLLSFRMRIWLPHVAIFRIFAGAKMKFSLFLINFLLRLQAKSLSDTQSYDSILLTTFPQKRVRK
jgi:hypothetical protein